MTSSTNPSLHPVRAATLIGLYSALIFGSLSRLLKIISMPMTLVRAQLADL
jgi:hypothetical protein